MTTLNFKTLPHTFDKYCVSHPNFQCLMLLYFDCRRILQFRAPSSCSVSKLSFELRNPIKMICSTFRSSCKLRRKQRSKTELRNLTSVGETQLAKSKIFFPNFVALSENLNFNHDNDMRFPKWIEPIVDHLATPVHRQI